MPAGRPSKYRKNMPDKVIAMMSEGMSKVECASELGIHYDTFNEWSNDETKPEFSDAVKAGERKSQAWWEKHAREAALSGTGNATLFIFNMKNRFSKDWTDRKEIGHDISDDMVNKIMRARGMSTEDLKAFVEKPIE